MKLRAFHYKVAVHRCGTEYLGRERCSTEYLGRERCSTEYLGGERCSERTWMMKVSVGLCFIS